MDSIDLLYQIAFLEDEKSGKFNEVDDNLHFSGSAVVEVIYFENEKYEEIRMSDENIHELANYLRLKVSEVVEHDLRLRLLMASNESK